MGKDVFKIYKSSRCKFIITDHALEQRKSFYLLGDWCGFVNQFKNNESIEEIKENAKEWLKARLKEPFDSQFSSKKSFEFLLNELENENQLQLKL
jgi:hypothetical protein